MSRRRWNPKPKQLWQSTRYNFDFAKIGQMFIVLTYPTRIHRDDNWRFYVLGPGGKHEFEFGWGSLIEREWSEFFERVL